MSNIMFTLQMPSMPSEPGETNMEESPSVPLRVMVMLCVGTWLFDSGLIDLFSQVPLAVSWLMASSSNPTDVLKVERMFIGLATLWMIKKTADGLIGCFRTNAGWVKTAVMFAMMFFLLCVLGLCIIVGFRGQNQKHSFLTIETFNQVESDVQQVATHLLTTAIPTVEKALITLVTVLMLYNLLIILNQPARRDFLQHIFYIVTTIILCIAMYILNQMLGIDKDSSSNKGRLLFPNVWKFLGTSTIIGVYFFMNLIYVGGLFMGISLLVFGCFLVTMYLMDLFSRLTA